MGERVNKFLCGTDSKIGDAAERLVGEAKACWCCSFFRGLLIGGVAGLLIGVFL